MTIQVPKLSKETDKRFKQSKTEKSIQNWSIKNEKITIKIPYLIIILWLNYGYLFKKIKLRNAKLNLGVKKLITFYKYKYNI